MNPLIMHGLMMMGVFGLISLVYRQFTPKHLGLNAGLVGNLWGIYGLLMLDLEIHPVVGNGLLIAGIFGVISLSRRRWEPKQLGLNMILAMVVWGIFLLILIIGMILYVAQTEY